MLGVLLSWFWIHSVMDQWSNQTLWVRYLLSWFWVHSVIEHIFDQTLCVANFTELILGTFSNWNVIKSDTLCQLFYWVDIGYIWYCTSDLRRHYVLDILMSWIWVYSVIDYWTTQILCFRYFTALILDKFGNWPVNQSGNQC